MIELSLAAIFLAGLLSFLSPCILPMVPFYISYITGISVSLDQEDNTFPLKHVLIRSVCFSLGIMVVFVALGASATALGQLFRAHFDFLRIAASVVIFIFGLHFLGFIQLSFLYRSFRIDDERAHSLGAIGAFVVGLAFAFAWTPCVGPILASILFLASTQDTAQSGVLYLTTYGFGMTLPFILSSVFFAPFLKWKNRYRRHLPKIEKAMGIMLITFSILIATNSVRRIALWLVENVEWISNVG